MEPDKQTELPEDGEIYTPRQKAVLSLLQMVAWTAAFTAILFVINS